MQLPVLGETTTALQQCIESVRIQEIERLDDNVSGQPFTIVTYPDAPHAGAAVEDLGAARVRARWRRLAIAE